MNQARGIGSGAIQSFASLDSRVSILAALILAGAALWAAYDLNASMQWVDHTDQVIGNPGICLS